MLQAWLALLLFPVAFLLAFGVGEGVATLLGHAPGSDGVAPLWVMALALVPALIVFWLPAVVVIDRARRAARTGDRGGRIPVIIALVIAIGFTLMNLLAPLLGG